MLDLSCKFSKCEGMKEVGIEGGEGRLDRKRSGKHSSCEADLLLRRWFWMGNKHLRLSSHDSSSDHIRVHSPCDSTVTSMDAIYLTIM